MFEVTKNDKEIIVTATLKKRKTISEKKIRVSWLNALEEAKSKFPDLRIKEVPDNKETATNYSDNIVTWKFEIVRTESRKNKKSKSSTKAALKEEQQPLTFTEEPATVEETSQSDQPAIVQEPTE